MVEQFCCFRCGSLYGKKSGFCFHCYGFDTIIPSFRYLPGNNVKSDVNVFPVESLRKKANIFECCGLKLSYPFWVSLYGAPGGGKSTLALKIASGLASKDFKVLYVSLEEGLSSDSLREKIKRLELSGFDVSDGWADGFDVYLFDSANTCSFSFSDYAELRKTKSVVTVLHETKDGGASLSHSFLHLADVVVRVENLVGSLTKSRFEALKDIAILEV